MKAVLFDAPGDAGALYLGEAPMPVAEEGEILVRVRATALNRADLLQRRGTYPAPPGASPILGLEIAGEVVENGGGFTAGDRIMGVVSGGGYAEYAAIPAGMAMPVPRAFTYEQAAAIPEAFLTAYLNLFSLGGLQQGETVLIHAGASGVGSAAIQLAREKGAVIFCTAGTDTKCEFCAGIGADYTINYREKAFAQVVHDGTDGRGVDLILDFVGAAYWNDNLAALARYGRLMLIGMMGGSKGALDLSPVMSKSLTISGTTLRRTPLPRKVAITAAFAAEFLSLFHDDVLRPVIDRVFPLAQAAEAHAHMESNANIGKIILSVD
jgi:putative PIG3 family NAD(P)H quinone oxidoreductase